MNHLKANDSNLPLNQQHNAAVAPQRRQKSPTNQGADDLYRRMIREQEDKGDNLMDQFGEDLRLDKQVVGLGYEDPEDLLRMQQ